MNEREHDWTNALLALPLLAVSACGGGATPAEQPESREAEAVALTRLSQVSEELDVLHPVEIAVEVDVDGPAFETDLVIGLESEDGQEGCVLGAMKLEHAVEGPEHLALGSEFIVNGECWPLTERDDARLFASFDPWRRLEEGATDVMEEADVSRGSLLSVMQLSRLSTEGCDACEVEVAVQPSPGLDAELRELDLSSAVAVLPIPADGQGAPGRSSTPDFSLSSRLRVTGLDKAQGLAPGEVWMSHRIRPAGAGESAWQALVDHNEAGFGDDGRPREEVAVSGPHDINRISALHLEGAVRDALVDGAWRDVQQLELETCLHTAFDQAIYAGQSAPRDNDCAILPVAVARVPLGADVPLGRSAVTKARSAETWGDDWGWNNSTFGYSGVSIDVWLDVNAADGPTQTYGGRDVLGAGSWFEAGALSTATIFDVSMDLIDLYATFIGYDSGGGGVAMKASIFLTDFIDPIELQIADGNPVSLQDIFDAAGLDIDPSLSMEYVIAGVDFDDGCGNVTAATKAVGTIGIDTNETSITVSSLSDGVEVSGTITPYLDIAGVAETSVSYGEYLSGGVSVTLSLLNLSIPFTVTAEYLMSQGGHALNFNEYAEAILTVLSGDISYYIKYKIPWPLCWSNCTKNHSGTLLDWNGYTAPALQLFDLDQSVTWDDPASVCGDDVCSWDEGSTCTADCGPTWMYADRVSVDEVWKRVRFPYSFSDPVVIVGPPSQSGGDPVVVRVRNVTSDDFEIKLQEFSYLDGDHAFEDVAWMVVEAGTHVAPAGPTWEAGTASAGGAAGNYSPVTFTNAFGSTPLVLASTMTYKGVDPFVLRADNVDASGMDLLVQEEEGAAGPDHNNLETAGYVAISGTPASWSGSGYGYQLYSSKSNGVDENWYSFGSFDLRVQEEQSLDTETDHSAEQLHVLRLRHEGVGDDLIFACDTTINGGDTAGIRWR